MFRQFEFEKHIYQNLEQIPISTLFKLEMLGLEIPLSVWKKIALEERWVLCHIPIRSKGERECYSDYLSYLLVREGSLSKTSSLASPERRPWEELTRIPQEVADKMRELNLPLFWPEWIKLDDMERYAVFKMCREKSEDPMIQQVVREFLGLSNLPYSAVR